MVERPPAVPPRRPPKGQSLWRDAWRRLKRNRFAMGGLVVVVLMTAAAVLADVLMPFDADYGQPWVHARPPGYEHPAVLAEVRFDAGRPPVAPPGIPDAIEEYMTRDGVVELTLQEFQEEVYRLKVRRGRVDMIQRQEGAELLRELEVSGEAEYLVEVDEKGRESEPWHDARLDLRRPLPEGFPFARDESSYIVVLKRVRPRTPEPETVRVEIAGGRVASILRGGGSRDELRVEGRDVIEVRHDGETVTLVHPLGTDMQGRDVLTRVLYGARISLMVGVVATVVSVLIGVVYGAIAGYASTRAVDAWSIAGMAVFALAASAAFLFLPWKRALFLTVLALAAAFAGPRLARSRFLARPVTTTGEFMMRVVDILYAIPFMFLVILLMVSFGRNLIILFVALGAVQWLTMARIVRGQVLSLKEKEFVEAAHMCGASHAGVLFRHLIPNTLGVVIVYATLTVPAVILQESFLAFIGLTVEWQGRALDSWGALVDQGRRALTNDGDRWWVLVWPSLAMAVTLFSLNFLGDGLRDALDPQQKGRT